jgi:hypothetical protein
MRGEEGTEFEARHLFLSGGLLLFLVCCAGYVLNGSKAIAGTAPHAACRHARSQWIARLGDCMRPQRRRMGKAFARPGGSIRATHRHCEERSDDLSAEAQRAKAR